MPLLLVVFVLVFVAPVLLAVAVVVAVVLVYDDDALASVTAARTPSVTQHRHIDNATFCSVSTVTLCSDDNFVPLLRGLKATCKILVAVVAPICSNRHSEAHRCTQHEARVLL